MERCQIAIIGAGPGGYVAAIRAAQLGLDTVLIERRDLGGTCLNRGCIPTKTLVHTSEVFFEAKGGAEIGIVAPEATIDYEALRARKAAVVDQIVGGVEKLVSANKIRLIRGNARIIAPGQVSVETPEGIVELECGDIVIAIGTDPGKLGIPGEDLPGVYDSDGILDEIPQLKRPIVLGAGTIGMEFAGIYAGFGAEVSVIARNKVLSKYSKDLVANLTSAMKKQGCTFYTQSPQKAIERDGDDYVVVCEHNGERLEVRGDGVLISIGRKVDTESLFDESLGIELSGQQIAVDAEFKTSVEHIYAIGDCAASGKPQLAHAASAQGIAVVSAIAGVECEIDQGTVPSCIYTNPEVAVVGITEHIAKERGIDVRIAKFPMGGNGRSVVAGIDRGFIKLIADADDRIIGAELLCGRATDIIGELCLAIANRLTVSDMARAIHPHPTFVEGVGEAVEAFGIGAIHAIPSRKR
ncbi:MAG: dihydrolipoyl dehydrogenase [Coriobacteriales bacterium]|nr:dihydrolipoyl dehydrogenase [Coriobacteriales bacterium]